MLVRVREIEQSYNEEYHSWLFVVRDRQDGELVKVFSAKIYLDYDEFIEILNDLYHRWGNLLYYGEVAP